MKSATPEGDLSAAEFDDLLKDPRATAEYRIVRATRRLLTTKGLEVSMDDIATEAELGRRTVFRYFSSRDELLARAMNESLDHFNHQVNDSMNAETDFETWLFSVVQSLHQTQLRAGRGLWQLAATDDDDLPAPLAKVNKKRRDSRHLLTQTIAKEAWRRCGHSGKLPRDVELAFALTISSFAVHSLHIDYSAQQDETVKAVSSMLHAFLMSGTA
jgi:AcrR family transcriptional regulator